MTTIKIVTDSTADIPQKLIDELDIHVVPLKVHFGDVTYHDGIDIDVDTFYSKLVEAEKMPTTSQPSPTDFVTVYQQIAKDSPGCTIISIHLAAALSGTYQSALLASTMLEEEVKVEVVDSRKTSYATGMIVQAAGEQAKQGKSVEETLKAIHTMIDNMHIIFVLDTLNYLQKGGRIGKASALAGSLLNIKPILSFTDIGEVYPADKVRGSKKARAKMIELMKQVVDSGPVDVAIVHSANQPLAEEVLDEVKQHFKLSSETITGIGPVVGTHAGPNAVGIVMISHEHYPK